MRTYDESVAELDRLLDVEKELGIEVESLVAEQHVTRWQIGRVCFEIFGLNPKTPTGASVRAFATDRRRTANAIYIPLRVYRVLGAWYERQISAVPFTIARLTVEHAGKDVHTAEQLMETWREAGEPEEAKWAESLKTFAKASDAHKPKEPSAAAASAERYIQRLNEAEKEIAFGPSVLDDSLRAKLLGALRSHAGRLRTLQNYYRRHGKPLPGRGTNGRDPGRDTVRHEEVQELQAGDEKPRCELVSAGDVGAN